MNEIIGFVTIGGLLLVQLVGFAYGYGKLSEGVKNIRDDHQTTQTEVSALKKEIIQIGTKVTILQTERNKSGG